MKQPDIMNLVQIAVENNLNVNHVTLIYLLLHDMQDVYTLMLDKDLVDNEFIPTLKERQYYVGMKSNIPILHSTCKNMFAGFINRPTNKTISSELVRLQNDEKLAETLRIETWIEQYRELFKGLRPKAMGDRIQCLLKMRWFVTEYKYDKDHILNATKKYIKDKQKDGYKYLRQADYFIRKQEQKHNETIETSDLLTYCEEYVPVENSTARDQWQYGIKLG